MRIKCELTLIKKKKLLMCLVPPDDGRGRPGVSACITAMVQSGDHAANFRPDPLAIVADVTVSCIGRKQFFAANWISRI